MSSVDDIYRLHAHCCQAIRARGLISPAAGMGGAVGFEKPCAIHGGINLGRRERGVAQKLLDRAEIAAALQKMRGEGMAQRVRRRGIGKPQRAAQARDRELDDAWAKRPTLGTKE